MQRISNDYNKMKRLSFRGDVIMRHLTEILLGTKQLQEIQNWLCPPDPSINHITAREAHHTGTAAWLVEGTIYHDWKLSGPLMWIHGKRTAFHTLPTLAADSL